MTSPRSSAGHAVRPRGGALRLLRRNREFRVLWTARAVSVLGDSLGLVALLVYLQAETGAAVAVALLLLAGDCVPGLFGPIAGLISDRYALRRVMVAGEVIQGVLVLAIAAALPPLPVLLLLVAVRGIAATTFISASRSALPRIVDDEDLEAANAALGVGTYGLESLGPLIAAALFALSGIRGVLLVDVATFAVSAALLAWLPRLGGAHRREATTGRGPAIGWYREVLAGLRLVWSIPTVRAVSAGFVGVVAFSGVDDVALVFLARDELGGTGTDAAVLYAGVGIGLLLGYLLLARAGRRWPAPALLLVGFAVSSAGNLVTGLAGSILAAMLLQTMRGAGIAAFDVGVNTHLQRVVPPGVLGQAFGTLYGAVGLGAGLSYALGGLLLAATDARITFVAAGAGGLLVSVATAVAVHRTGNHR
ncbi:MFS transporter [Actinomadura sp. KC345]|uniref:MFS transporter n=1 Tax=Actinomadura sp. KC345 TaxID=2530371 RepID=UPI00105219A2|nr:MFS transporter [Actinomadura sp. KC345]TDC48334.1 MFS transporter [Actinomadura sp. KC345]